MNAVSNSTPLIYLSKLGKMNSLKNIFNTIVIPEAVYKEVVLKGKEMNRPEIVSIENLIQEGFIKVEKASTRLEINTLHKGELEAISLAQEKKIPNILIDDKEGVEVAKVLGLRVWRTTAILFALLKLKSIKFDEFERLLIELSNSGYFITADIFNHLVKEARKL